MTTTISNYYPDEGKFSSESDTIYDLAMKEDSHLFLAVALARLAEGKVSLQEAYESIAENYNIQVVKFEAAF